MFADEIHAHSKAKRAETRNSPRRRQTVKGYELCGFGFCLFTLSRDNDGEENRVIECSTVRLEECGHLHSQSRAHTRTANTHVLN